MYLYLYTQHNNEIKNRNVEWEEEIKELNEKLKSQKRKVQLEISELEDEFLMKKKNHKEKLSRVIN